MPEDQPFFLSCGFFLPHVPVCDPEVVDLYPEDTLTMPPIIDDDRSDAPKCLLVYSLGSSRAKNQLAGRE